jgi:hypothetical protein
MTTDNDHAGFVWRTRAVTSCRPGTSRLCAWFADAPRRPTTLPSSTSRPTGGDYTTPPSSTRLTWLSWGCQRVR